MDEFIRTKWVAAPGTSALKGDWRRFRAGGDCLEARSARSVCLLAYADRESAEGLMIAARCEDSA